MSSIDRREVLKLAGAASVAATSPRHMPNAYRRGGDWIFLLVSMNSSHVFGYSTFACSRRSSRAWTGHGLTASGTPSARPLYMTAVMLDSKMPFGSRRIFATMSVMSIR